MDEPKRRLIADWLQKASHDICSAEQLMQPTPILDTAAYGTAFRYPGSDVVPQTENASAALIMARNAFSLVQRIIDETG